eukprot:scaffold330293_cov64-Tisochrysis_lutea.AAC.2
MATAQLFEFEGAGSLATRNLRNLPHDIIRQPFGRSMSSSLAPCCVGALGVAERPRCAFGIETSAR